MKVRTFALILLLFACATTPAHAWDELGHRVIARIAWNQLTPAARARAVELLRSAPPRSGIAALRPGSEPPAAQAREWFGMASVWPDLIRDRHHPGFLYGHGDWHYVNLFWRSGPFGSGVRDLPDMPRAGLLTVQLRRISAELADPTVPDSAKAIDLAWALHLVGDAHQPLHNSARVTAQEPEGDRGGNLFRLDGFYPDNNLHAYWDALVSRAFPWRPGMRSDADYVGAIAAQIEDDYPPSRFRAGKLQDDFDGWASEGVRVAQETAYPRWLRRGERVPARYRARAWRAAEPRVALAGYRLAELLNRSLGP